MCKVLTVIQERKGCSAKLGVKGEQEFSRGKNMYKSQRYEIVPVYHQFPKCNRQLEGDGQRWKGGKSQGTWGTAEEHGFYQAGR